MIGQWRTLPVTGRLFESARWLDQEQCFQWVDILSARIFRWDPVTDALDSFALGFDFLSLATPWQMPGVQILASRDTVYTYRWGHEPEPFAVLPVGPGARLNDGIVDMHGRVWVGSMGLIPNRAEPLGKLWRIDVGGSVAEMASGLGISNGITWSNGTEGFHVDSLAGALYAVADRGESLSRELVLSFPDSVDPDGILLADSIVWIAVWEGGALGRFDPAAREYSEVPVPASRPSSLAISSERVLVTTAGQGAGSDLDSSAQVLVAPLGSLEIDRSATRRECQLVGVW
jgi:sugar lactone lactonase YvrE